MTEVLCMLSEVFSFFVGLDDADVVPASDKENWEVYNLHSGVLRRIMAYAESNWK